MESGLASVMTYGNGEGNTITSYYAGTMEKKKRKKKKKGITMACKRKKKK